MTVLLAELAKMATTMFTTGGGAQAAGAAAAGATAAESTAAMAAGALSGTEIAMGAASQVPLSAAAATATTAATATNGILSGLGLGLQAYSTLQSLQTPELKAPDVTANKEGNLPKVYAQEAARRRERTTRRDLIATTPLGIVKKAGLAGASKLGG